MNLFTLIIVYICEFFEIIFYIINLCLLDERNDQKVFYIFVIWIMITRTFTILLKKKSFFIFVMYYKSLKNVFYRKRLIVYYIIFRNTKRIDCFFNYPIRGLLVKKKHYSCLTRMNYLIKKACFNLKNKKKIQGLNCIIKIKHFNEF